MSKQKLYKYASVQSAIMILRNGNLLLNNANFFNDPYDCSAKINYKMIDKYLKNYVMFTIIEKNITKFKYSKIIALEFKMLKKIYFKNKKYGYVVGFNKLFDKITKKDENIKKEYEVNFNKLKNNIKRTLEKLKNDVLITCFSDRNDSILMWSHYASSHSGVCFEYEVDDINIKKVDYRKKIPILKIDKLFSKILCNLVNNYDFEILNESDKNKMLNELSKVLTIKSKDWNYEHEFRAIFSVNDWYDNKIELNDEKYFYKIGYPSKIYIGSRADFNKINELLIMAKKRKIPVIFMKQSEIDYKIVPDNKYMDINPKPLLFKVYNPLETLQDEIESCLDKGEYLAAFNLALIIPSLCGKIYSPNDDPKNQFIQWYKTYIFSDDIEDKGLNAEECWNLKQNFNNRAEIEINCKTKISGVGLCFEHKNSMNLYADAEISSNENGTYHYCINIRAFCNKMIYTSNVFKEKNKEAFKNLLSYPILDLDKKRNLFIEIQAYNNSLREKI